MTKATITEIPVRTDLRAAGISFNHNEIPVRTPARAGGIKMNHNEIAVSASVA